MRILKVRYRDAQEFLQNYDATFPHGGLVYPTRQQLAIGEPVIVELAFPELEGKIMLKGKIAWRRPGQHRLKVQAGLGIELYASEARRRDYVLSVAKGQAAVGVHRRHRRLPISLPTRWRVRESRGTEQSQLGDIGPGGAFVQTSNKPDIGTELILDVTVPGSVAPISVAGRVAWTTDMRDASPATEVASYAPSQAAERPGEQAGQEQGPSSDSDLGEEKAPMQAKSNEGFGVEFRARDAGGVRRLRELVRRLER